MSVDAILVEAAKLPPEDRARLISELEKGLEADGWAGEAADPELLALLDERLAEEEANPGVGYTLDEVIAYIKRPRS